MKEKTKKQEHNSLTAEIYGAAQLPLSTDRAALPPGPRHPRLAPPHPVPTTLACTGLQASPVPVSRIPDSLIPWASIRRRQR